ncbi:MAG: hypothetical protein ACKD6N_03535 [Candidatus Bathyarchaeota archaeon]
MENQNKPKIEVKVDLKKLNQVLKEIEKLLENLTVMEIVWILKALEYNIFMALQTLETRYYTYTYGEKS